MATSKPPVVLMVVLEPGTPDAQVIGLSHAFATYPCVNEVLPVCADEQGEVAAALDLLVAVQPPLVP
jgi:hypothetical protein